MTEAQLQKILRSDPDHYGYEERQRAVKEYLEPRLQNYHRVLIKWDNLRRSAMTFHGLRYILNTPWKPLWNQLTHDPMLETFYCGTINAPVIACRPMEIVADMIYARKVIEPRPGRKTCMSKPDEAAILGLITKYPPSKYFSIRDMGGLTEFTPKCHIKTLRKAINPRYKILDRA